MAPSNDLPIRPSSSAPQTVAVTPRSRATCTMAGEASVAYTVTPRAAKCAASSPVPQPISRIRSPGWKSGSISRQTRLRWARPIGGGGPKRVVAWQRCGRRQWRSSCLHLAVGVCQALPHQRRFGGSFAAQQLIGQLIETARVAAADLDVAIRGGLPRAQLHQLGRDFVVVRRAL